MYRFKAKSCWGVKSIISCRNRKALEQARNRMLAEKDDIDGQLYVVTEIERVKGTASHDNIVIKVLAC